jgi:6,7-dimethyl-8-ribityllumazine synthase
VKEPSVQRVSARGLRVALVRSAFNARIVEGLAAGARRALREAGAADAKIESFEAPGAFELPLLAKAAAESGRFDAVVALGAVIRGDTDHYEHIAREAATGSAAPTSRTPSRPCRPTTSCVSSPNARRTSASSPPTTTCCRRTSRMKASRR